MSYRLSFSVSIAVPCTSQIVVVQKNKHTPTNQHITPFAPPSNRNYRRIFNMVQPLLRRQIAVPNVPKRGRPACCCPIMLPFLVLVGVYLYLAGIASKATNDSHVVHQRPARYEDSKAAPAPSRLHPEPKEVPADTANIERVRFITREQRDGRDEPQRTAPENPSLDAAVAVAAGTIAGVTDDPQDERPQRYRNH